MAGYSGTPLQKKLGIKPDTSIFILHAPDNYVDLISPLPEKLRVLKKLSSDTTFIHLFTKDKKTFEKEFRTCMKSLAKDGMLWVSWPKKSSGVTTDVDEHVVRTFGLKEGLVDVKICAVDDVWSGLKFVFRLKDR